MPEAVSKEQPYRSRLQYLLLAVLAVLALLSVARGMQKALASNGTPDFQWSGTRMLLDRIDPWQDYLRGDPEHRILFAQIPNYLPLLYVLLTPFGLLTFASAKLLWMLTNLSFTVTSAVVCGRYYKLDAYRSSLLLALLLMSTAMRNSLGLGQQSLLVLFLWVVALCHTPSGVRYLTLGISYFKYSFAPLAFFFILLEAAPVAAVLSLLPALLGFFLVFFWLGGSLSHPAGMISLLISPLKVATTGYFGPPGPNLMEIGQVFVDRHQAALWLATTLIYVLPMALAAVLMFRVRFVSRPAQLALLAVISLTCFKHHAYDDVLLLFPAAFALQHIRQAGSRWMIGLLVILWYFDRVVFQVVPLLNLYLVDFVALIAIGFLVYRVASNVPAAELQGVRAG